MSSLKRLVTGYYGTSWMIPDEVKIQLQKLRSVLITNNYHLSCLKSIMIIMLLFSLSAQNH